MAKTDFDIPLDISKIPKKELVRVKDDWSDLIIDKVAMKTGEAFLLKRLSKFANTNKDNIAFCGYHGWHDWYLSSNLQNKKNLDKNLMSNLSSKGIPLSANL